MFNITLGNYEESFQLYGAYQVLLRALIEAKFSEKTFDDRILHSQTLADLGNELVEKMDILGEEIGIKPKSAQRRWLTLDSTEHRVFLNLLRKLPKDIGPGGDMHTYLDSLDTGQKLGYLNMLLSPYCITEQAGIKFWGELEKIMKK